MNFFRWQAFERVGSNSVSYTAMKAILLATILVISASSARAQFRPGATSEERPASTLEAMSSHGDDFFSRLFDPSRFSMHQSYSFSYMSSSAGSMGLGMYTNSLGFRASDDLMVSADISAVYSPFSSFGNAFQKSINGIYLSNARLDWKMGENTFLRVEYVGVPTGSSAFYDPFYTPMPRFR